MKKLTIVAFTLTLIAVNAFANDVIKKAMDDMGANLKQIVVQIKDPKQNASTAALCDHLIADIAAAKTGTPDVIETLAAGDQASAQAKYVADLDKLSASVLELKADLQQNNNTAAVAVLKQIAAARNDGHSEFNP
jgi:hypothetical protein